MFGEVRHSPVSFNAPHAFELHERPLSAAAEQNHRISHRWTVHARRACWHSRYGETDCFRVLLKQPMDRRCRDMSFDRVSFDLGCVTAGEM